METAQPSNSWSGNSEKEILQQGRIQDWDNRELKVIAGSLQRIAKALEISASSENYTVKYFTAAHDNERYREEIKQLRDKIDLLESKLPKE